MLNFQVTSLATQFRQQHLRYEAFEIASPRKLKVDESPFVPGGEGGMPSLEGVND